MKSICVITHHGEVIGPSSGTLSPPHLNKLIYMCEMG